MFIIVYAPSFIRMYKGLPSLLKGEVGDKISLFKYKENHQKLKVHKLKGNLDNTYAFSVNYKVRVIFEYENKKTINLLYIGGHDELYK